MGELQSRMTQSEFIQWQAYREIAGPMDYARRYDYPAALTAWASMAAQGGKAKLSEFLPRFDMPDGDFNDVDRQFLALLKDGQNKVE